MKLNKSTLIIYCLLGVIAAMLYRMIDTWQRYEAQIAWLRYLNGKCSNVAEEQGNRIRHYIKDN